MSDSSEKDNIKNRIWITSKTRIYAEKRYRKYDIMSHLVLSLLSAIVISLTLFKDLLPQGAPLETYTIVYSIFILIASIVVFGFRFGETATLHRECYLQLQRLNDSKQDADELIRCYHDILSSYPNHSDMDYECLVLGRTFPNLKGLKRLDGTHIDWTFGMLFQWSLHQIIFWLLPVALIGASVGTIFWIW